MRLFAVVVLSLCSFAAQAVDDWIGLDPDPLPVLIGVDFGQDEADDQIQSLLLSLPFAEDFGFDGFYSSTRISDDREEFDSLALASILWLELNYLVDVELIHFFEGSDEELEKETLAVALGMRSGDWQFRVQVEQGELLIFTRDEINNFVDTRFPERFDVDLSALGVSLGWQRELWYWRSSYFDYDYDRDLRGLETSALVQLVVDSAAQVQSSLLISRSTSLTLGHADLDNDFSLQLARSQSAVDGDTSATLTIAWNHWSSERLGYYVAASDSTDTSGIGLTLGLRWTL